MKALVIILIILGSFDWKITYNGREHKGLHFWLNMIALTLFCIFFVYKG